MLHNALRTLARKNPQCARTACVLESRAGPLVLLCECGVLQLRPSSSHASGDDEAARCGEGGQVSNVADPLENSWHHDAEPLFFIRDITHVTGQATDRGNLADASVIGRSCKRDEARWSDSNESQVRGQLLSLFERVKQPSDIVDPLPD